MNIMLIFYVILGMLVDVNCLGGLAKCTYHLYEPHLELKFVACSDGRNGIMNWGYRDLAPMFPYVTAWQESSWGS